MTFSRSTFAKAGAAVLAVAAMGTAGLAQARSDVFFSINGQVAPGVNVGVSNAPYYNAPYYQPQPVYVQPAPVYYPQTQYYQQPAPVYYQPAPVYYRPAPLFINYSRGWGGHHRGHGHGRR